MSAKDKGGPDKPIEDHMNALRHITVGFPSKSEYDAAVEHLLRRAEASYNAFLVTEEIQRAIAVRGRGTGRSVDDKSRHLDVVRFLRDAGKLSHEEYIFMAGRLAFYVHEDRWLNGDYEGELRLLSDSIKAIEAAEGLKEDEYWSSTDGPPRWQKPNKQYEQILDRHIESEMRELGLKDIADLFRDNRSAFDLAFERGRRAIFHKDDRRNAVASLVAQYEAEARRSEACELPYAALVMYGAACEARLLLMVLEFPEEANIAKELLPSNLRPPGDPMKWTLDVLIKVANKAGWLKGSEFESPILEWATTLKDIRNLLHAGRHALKHPHVVLSETQVQDARSIYVMICDALSEAMKNAKARSISMEAS